MSKVKMVLAVLLILGVVAQAYAVTNTVPPIPPDSTLKFKFADVGSFFVPPATGGGTFTPTPNPSGTFVPQAAGNELRNVVTITQIFAPEGALAPFWTPTVNNTQELSGLIWGLEALRPAPDPAPYNPSSNVPTGNDNFIYLGDSGRNPATLPAGYDPTGVTGGRLVIYIDGTGAIGSVVSPMAPYTTTPPSLWDENVGTPDTFPGVNQNGEELWLDCVFIPFPDPLPTIAPGGPVFPAQGEVLDGTLLREDVVVGSTQTGQGSAFLMIVGGTGQSLFVKGGENSRYLASGGYNGTGALPPGVTADISIGFRVGPNNVGGVGAPPWNNWSDDPALVQSVGNIPEPLTMLGLLLGSGGLTSYLRRRRTA